MEIVVPAHFSPHLQICCVPVPAAAPRHEARRLVRLVVQARLGELFAMPAAAVQLFASPGQPVRLAPPLAQVGVSFSHDAGLSLAAINQGGAVGVDLMCCPPPWDDLADLARDYLGPQLAATLAEMPATARQRTFAQAWTAHEASLKCLGLPLAEWSPALAERLATCRACALPLPAGWVASVAISC